MRKIVLGAAILALSACGNPTAKSDDPLNETGQMMPVEPDSGIGDGAGPPDAPSAPDTEAQTAMIPARFHGVWDYEGGTCAPESDLRAKIGPDSITFYESYGTVTDVTNEGEDVLVALDMEGEGDTWTQVTRLSLSGEDSAERLSKSDGEKPKVVDDYPSKRCAE